MKKSALLVATPSGVRSVSRPEVPEGGTLAVRLVMVALLTVAAPRLNLRRSFAGTGSKFVPLTVTLVPGVPMPGVVPVIVGAWPAVTVKALVLAADPDGVV